VGDVLTGSATPGVGVTLVVAAAPEDGRGHAARAVALAEALVEVGVAVGIRYLRGGPTATERRRLDELGVGDDGGRSAGVTVVDLPDPNELDPGGLGAVVVFDDRELFRGRADVIVQPSLPKWRGPATAGRVLAGYGYAPIARRWLAAREHAGSPSADLPRVLVCFGGSDPARVTERIGPAVAADPRWTTSVVVGADFGGRLPRGVEAVRDPADLPERVASADLVLLGAGTMKFEVACLGRPMLLLAVVDDQLPVGPPFAATGAAEWLGDGREIDPASVVELVAALIADPAQQQTMGRNAAATIDGRGGSRIAEVIRAIR
jgi:spore coat polysaccharide biosynthesis predicted glycosyltransferase SpsG